jgi:hypothetical protein
MSLKAQNARGFVVDYREENATEAFLYYRVWFSRAAKMNGGRPTVARFLREDGAWKIDVTSTAGLTAKIARGRTPLGLYDGTREWWKRRTTGADGRKSEQLMPSPSSSE